MKKRILKTILKDFFKLRYVVIWVAVVILVGIGVVLASSFGNNNGHVLFPGHSKKIDDTTLGPCVVVSNNGPSAYFIPTRTGNEFTHFKNAVAAYLGPTTPAKLSVTHCSTTCVPTVPCGVKECGGDSCGVSCGTCTSGNVCNSHQLCQPLVTACGNPQQICPQGYYCSTLANPQGVCLPIGIY